jgi:hypothetical protein
MLPYTALLLLFPQVFAAWHAKKRAEREAKRAAELEERKKKVSREGLRHSCVAGSSRAASSCLWWGAAVLPAMGVAASAAMCRQLHPTAAGYNLACGCVQKLAYSSSVRMLHCTSSIGCHSRASLLLCCAVCCRLLQGLLNGREIFLSDNFVALDDANAGGDDEYRREDDEEARINDMFEQVRLLSGCRTGGGESHCPGLDCGLPVLSACSSWL